MNRFHLTVSLFLYLHLKFGQKEENGLVEIY